MGAVSEKAKAHRREKQREYSRARYERRKANPPAPPAKKRCPRCRLVKPAADFCRNLANYDGLNAYCFDCRRENRAARKCQVALRRWHVDAVAFARARAKKNGLAFDLTPDDVLARFEVQGGRCHWYGVPMVPSGDSFHPQKPSLDRLDNSKGYTRDNIVLSCMAANLGRCASDTAVFGRFCDLLRSGS